MPMMEDLTAVGSTDDCDVDNGGAGAGLGLGADQHAGALLRCALLVALCARALLQQPHPCSGSAQSSMPSGDASDRCHTRAMAGGVLCRALWHVQSDRERG